MGYSALCLAEGLTDDGKIITLDMQPETHEIAKNFGRKANLKDKIDGRIGRCDENNSELWMKLSISFLLMRTNRIMRIITIWFFRKCESAA